MIFESAFESGELLQNAPETKVVRKTEGSTASTPSNVILETVLERGHERKTVDTTSKWKLPKKGPRTNVIFETHLKKGQLQNTFDRESDVKPSINASSSTLIFEKVFERGKIQKQASSKTTGKPGRILSCFVTLNRLL